MKNNKPISDKKEIGNWFNNFFTNVGPNHAKQISLPDISIDDYLGKGLESSGFLWYVYKLQTHIIVTSVIKKC